MLKDWLELAKQADKNLRDKLEAIKELNREMNIKLDYAKESIDNFKSQMDYISHYISNLGENLRLNVETAIKFKYNYNDFFLNIHEQIKEFGKINQRFSTIMIELGWPPHSDLYPDEIRKIVDIYDEYGIDSLKVEIDEYYIKRFNEDEINKLIKSWESREWLNKRVPILTEGLEAHFNKKYFSSVATILPQIEGTIADGFGHVGKMPGYLLEEYLEKLLVDDNDLSFDIAIQKFYFNIVLAGFEHGSVPKSFLSRHAILHGGDVNYGTITNSLKCILLFNYIQDKIKFVSVGNGRAYHLLNCSVVNKYKDKEWFLYSSKREAKENGKLPCELCKGKTTIA